MRPLKIHSIKLKWDFFLPHFGRWFCLFTLGSVCSMNLLSFVLFHCLSVCTFFSLYKRIDMTRDIYSVSHAYITFTVFFLWISHGALSLSAVVENIILQRLSENALLVDYGFTEMPVKFDMFDMSEGVEISAPNHLHTWTQTATATSSTSISFYAQRMAINRNCKTYCQTPSEISPWMLYKY